MAKNDPYVNRELSWLKFNERVLEEAEDGKVPAFERIKFVSIFLSNLDEFFMVRVGTLTDQVVSNKIKIDDKTGMTPQDQLDAIFEYVNGLIPRKDKALRHVLSLLKRHEIERILPSQMNKKDETFLNLYFKTELLPLVSPQVIDKRHPFPFLDNLQQYVAVELDTKGENMRVGVIPVSPAFPRFVRLPGEHFRYCLMEDILLHYADKVFRKYEVQSRCIFRITRNADIDIKEGLFDEELDYREAMHELLKMRKKLCPVRLEFYGAATPALQKYLCKKLNLEDEQVFCHTTPLDLRFVFSFERVLKQNYPGKLFFPPLAPHKPMFLEGDKPILPQVEQKDVFLSYPYESMNYFVRMLNEAADDPSVVSIKITLYRVASNSKIIDALIRAKEAGKEVYVVVELRARFDEANNIGWAEHLEEAGISLSYGLDDYKTHSKLCLITKKTPTGISYITQVGTGNYNEKTAAQYTDMAIITADQIIGQDAADFFQNISMGKTTRYPKELLIAPEAFSQRLSLLIDEQIAVAQNGEDASITIKINSLTDKGLIDKLIEASCAGVPVRLIIRGICCLKAGIPGLTENIQIISIVGRYLEHSRIYSFGVGPAQKLYISSGDWMTRSVKRRIEIAAPIHDQEIKAEINHFLEIQFSDNVKARVQREGVYQKKQDGQPSLDSQVYFFTNERYQ